MMSRRNRVLLGLGLVGLLVGWLLAGDWTAGDQSRAKWMRVIETELELAPKMSRTFQPRPYQTVELIVGSGDFGFASRDAFQRRTTPKGGLGSLRLDTSDPDFLIASVGYLDNMGQWRHDALHYIPWSKLVDVSIENSRALGAGPPSIR